MALRHGARRDEPPRGAALFATLPHSAHGRGEAGAQQARSTATVGRSWSPLPTGTYAAGLWCGSIASMKPERQPQEQPTSSEPPQELTVEMSFAAAMHRAVDDLFTCQAIADRLQMIPVNEAMTAMLADWKRGLTHQLNDIAQTMVYNVVATMDLIQSGARSPLSETERQEWAQIERWNKPFTVAAICREDLRGILSDEEIEKLDDSDMEKIADKMSDSYRDSGGYWESLEIIAKSVLAWGDGDQSHSDVSKRNPGSASSGGSDNTRSQT